MVLIKNPGRTEFAVGDTPNAILTYNMWREYRLIETDPRMPRDFRFVDIAEELYLLIKVISTSLIFQVNIGLTRY